MGESHLDNNDIRVLIADDEESITDSIAYALKREGYRVEKAYDGGEAIVKIKEFRPHAVILDVMMPRYNGYEVIRRSEEYPMGILMLTAKGEVSDKVLGLELGADDYVTKPFDLSELLARVKSLVRRLKKASLDRDIIESNSLLEHNDGVLINLLEHHIYIDGKAVEFKPKEFDLLAFLVKNSPRVFTRENILDSVWEMEYAGGTRTVDIHIQRIRKKLGTYGGCVCTVPKIGYKVVDFKGNLL